MNWNCSGCMNLHFWSTSLDAHELSTLGLKINYYGPLLVCCNALVNLIPHYPPPGPTRAFDKGIDERPFPQGGAFDTAPFNVCWLESGL